MSLATFAPIETTLHTTELWLRDLMEDQETIREPLERLLHKGACSEQNPFPVTTTGV
jgi:hypothetical protein